MEVVVENLTKRLHGRTVLDNVSLTMRSGEVVGLQGINGSGKTMLMRAICGLIAPTSGSVTINGKILGSDISFPPRTGLLIEEPAFLPGLTAYDNLMLLASIQGIAGSDEVRSALARVGLDADDRRSYRKFSLGMKQRLGIACAIFEDPELVVLDEPFNALDEAACELVRGIVRDLHTSGKLVVLASHSREDLESLSDRIVCMSAGCVVGEG